MSAENAVRRRWSETELLLALHLYVRTPFGRQDSRNPEIIELAARLGRTPSSVSMKLNNLASLDPVEQARGIKGLPGASRADREIFNRYLNDREDTLLACEVAWEADDGGYSVTDVADPSEPSSLGRVREGTTSQQLVRIRHGQNFFRKSLDSLYQYRCAITGLSLRPLLRASHIKPWSACSGEEKLDPFNGILLSATYDAAFDAGVITLTNDLRWAVSAKARHAQCEADERFLNSINGQKLNAPEGREPKLKYIEYHQSNIFDR